MGDISQDQRDSEEGDWCRGHLEKILSRKEKSIKVDDVDVLPACAVGENFAAEVYRVVVYGRRLCLGAWTGERALSWEWTITIDCESTNFGGYAYIVYFAERNLRYLMGFARCNYKYDNPHIRKTFIVKRALDPSSPCHKLYNCLGMFQNEIVAYEEVLPMFQSYLDKEAHLNESNELCFPKYYGQCQNLLVLQDLQTEGYQLVNRTKGFSVRECSLVLRELSKFHAVSFALKKDQRISLTKVANKLKETIFLEEHVHSVTGLFWENSAKCALRSLEESGDPRFKRAEEFLKSHSGRILGRLSDLIRRDSSKFEVLCHGDLWTNNIMLRYCDSGYPIGVKFIDLQVMRYCSCVLDVMHVLFTSSRPVIYEKCFDLLISEYYNSLKMNLENLETSIEFTFEELMEELKRKIPFGVFVACVMLPCVTRTTPSKPSETKLDREDLTSESELEKTYKTLGPIYHERLRALFLALTNSNLI